MMTQQRNYRILAACLVVFSCICGCKKTTHQNTGNKSPAMTRDLSRYIGKYPSDLIDSHSWSNDPLVVQAIRQAVMDTEILQWVLESKGPATPIGTVNGKIVSSACEAHNCNSHHWSTLIDPTTGHAEVCYADDDVTPGKTRWFQNGKEEIHDGVCPEASN